MTKTEESGRMNVVVTTKHRGVFFGQVEAMPEPTDTVVGVTNLQMVIYWTKETKGVPGLASHGPADGSRVSRPVPGETQLRDVTAVFPATDDAAGRFAKCPW